MNGIIITTTAPLQLRPSRCCELADEALFGWTVQVLEAPCAGWYKVRTHYGYEGYVPAESLSMGDGNAQRWAELKKMVVLRGSCTVLAAPDVQSWPLCALTRGALVAIAGSPNEDGWMKVTLPDGSEGYTKVGFLGAYYEKPSSDDEETLRKNICGSAFMYMGAHYRWGGKSPLGLDCSGLTFMAYFLNGVIIYRDAHIKEGYPLHEIAKEDMKPADLIFFPGHVAMYLGNGKYIHSTAKNGSDGVVINSLNPEDA
ncbi:MAG: NlpC/P60 family protein, partial [Oscillospiraceae bacterium]